MATKITKKDGKVKIVSEADFLKEARKNGSSARVSNAKTKIYDNPNRNGTTAIILAALSCISKTKKSFSGEEFIEGAKRLRRENYGNEDWKRLEANYRKFPENRSASPASKVSPVLRDQVRKVKTGIYIGYQADKIADSTTRKLLGFTF